MIVHGKTTCDFITKSQKPSALTDKERRHLEDSMRHNDKLMKRLAQL